MKIAPTVTPYFAPKSPLLAAKKPGQVPTTPAAPTTSAADGTQPAALGGPSLAPPQPDLQQFFAAWGTSNQKFDLTQDGTVDGKDLAILLGNAPAPSNASPQTVLESWGKAGGGGDLNGDGTVDGADLAIALGNAQPSASDALVAGVKDAWGTANKTYDLNKDGTVDGADLGIALSGGNGAADAPMAPEAIASKITDAVFASRDSDQDGSLAMDEIPVAAIKIAESIDANQDGAIDKSELQSRLSEELSKLHAQQPNSDLTKIANRWLDAFLGRTDPRVLSARTAYGNLSPLMSNASINASA
ncbi:MAG: EF-hand domain-containing protein [Phycisphaerales bacterium]